MSKKVIIPLAPGCEELEAITIIDLLRRAEIDVTSVSLDSGDKVSLVKASRGSVLLPDMTLDQALNFDYDMLVLPGGLPGADNLNNDQRIHSLIEKMDKQQNYIAAICAAPRVLMQAGVLSKKTFTCYPGSVDIDNFNDDVTKGSILIDKNVIQCHNIITSKGPGTAIDFALTLIELLLDKVEANKVADALLYNR